MHFLVTGATGFLGSHICHALLESGHTVSAIKRSTSSTSRVLDIYENCRWYDIDCLSIQSIFAHEKYDCVIHTACTYGRQGELISTIVNTNVSFPLLLLENSSNYGVSLFINTDTMLPSDVSPYALSKSQFSDWLKMFSLSQMKIVNMKIEHMYGPGDDSKKFINWLLSQIQLNVPSIALTQGEQMRDFIYIDDVVSAYLAIINNITKLKSYNEFEVGTGISITVRNTVEKLLSLHRNTHPKNRTQLEFGKIPYREREPMLISVDNHKLLELGWKPKYEIVEGLQELMNIVFEDEL